MTMEKEITVQKKTSCYMFLLLLFAVCASCLYLGLELANDSEFWIQRQTGRTAEAFAVLLFYAFIRAEKDKTVTIQKCILLSIGALSISYLALFWERNWLTIGTGLSTIGLFLLITAPVYVLLLSRMIIQKIAGNRSVSAAICGMPWWTLMAVFYAVFGMGSREEKALFLVWSIESIIWVIALQPKEEEKEGKRRLWMVWVICLGLFLCLSCMEGIGGDWYLFVRCQEPVLMICLPFVYRSVFRKMDKSTSEELGGKRLVSPKVLSGWGYFGISFVIYLFMNGISYRLAVKSGAYPIDTGIYYVLWSVFIFVSEKKAEQRKEMTEEKKWKRDALFLPAVFYIVGCGYVMVKVNSRIREIFCSLTDRGTGFETGSHIDWLGYRMAAVRCFLSGRNDELDRLFLPYGSKGYQYFESGSSAGGLFFRQGDIWMWMISVCIMAIGLILLCWKWQNPDLNRCKNYLAICYFIRLFLSILCIVGMVDSYHVEMPFTRYVMVDGLLLGILLLKGRRYIE